MSHKKLAKEIRCEQILRAGIKLGSVSGGWNRLTRYRLAEAARCSEASINIHFGDMASVKYAIAELAVIERNLSIIAQSLAAHDGYINLKKTPQVLLQAAAASLLP